MSTEQPEQLVEITSLKDDSRRFASILVPHGGKGKEIAEYLVRELGIPTEARWFEVRIAVDEALTVKCEYFPKVEEPGNGV